MKTVTIKAFVHADKHSTNGYTIYPVDMSREFGTVCLGSVEVEYTIPPDFNAVGAEVALLNKQLDKLAADYLSNTTALKSRIRDLQCLPAPGVTA